MMLSVSFDQITGASSTDSDNDGLPDLIEENFGTDKNNPNDANVIQVIIENRTRYLLDSNNDGTSDKLYDGVGRISDVRIAGDGTYLIDLDGNNYVYNPVTKAITRSQNTVASDFLWLFVIIGVIVAIVIIIVGVLFKLGYISIYEEIIDVTVTQPKKSKKKIIIAVVAIIVVATILVSVTAVYIYQNKATLQTISTINAKELLNGDFKSGDTAVFEDIVTDIKTMNTSYGVYTLLRFDAGIDKMGIISDSNINYPIGSKFQQMVHINKYQVNGHAILSADEMYGLYLILPSAIEITLNAVSMYIALQGAGIELTIKSIDSQGKTQYEVFSNGSKFSLDDLGVKLLKLNSDTNGGSFNKNINSSIDYFSLEYTDITGDYSKMVKIDAIESLNNSISQNSYINLFDENSNGFLDDHDIFNVTISPTVNKYTLDTYLLVIGKGDVNSLNNVTGITYIINWYQGVFSQKDLWN
ncbi:MAG: hypothetical protein NT038_00505 [Euryarchaeota archaeon]|nr:hypothetical protein [Euryarchaeota archaeon]